MSVLFPTNVTVYSFSEGTRVKGKWVPGSFVESTIIGRVRNFTAFEVANLPEGKTNIGHVKIYSNSALNTAVDGGSSKGDIVIWQGRYYEVVKETHRPQGVINHYKYEAEFRQPNEVIPNETPGII